MNALELKNVSVIYGDKTPFRKAALDNINVAFEKGKITGLIGHTGSGKSTLVNLLNGLSKPTEGRVLLNGSDIWENPKEIGKIRYRVGLVMQYPEYQLFEETVRKDIAYGPRNMKLSEEEIDRRVREAAATLDITQYLDRKPKNLSGGQRQRVAIGRAIVREPAVFLMDEPLSNLDAKLRNQMRAEIILLRKRLDTTFIYVTHDQTEAMTLGDRIVIMKDGFIQQVGTPQEVFDTPKNLFVAGFIGAPQMNFIPSKLVKKGQGYDVNVLGTTITMEGAKLQKLMDKNVESQDIILGVRPEHTTVCFDKTEGAIESTILVNEMMGSELHLHVTTNGEDKIILRLPTIDLTDEQRAGLTYGNKLYFTFASKVVHMFDPQTEESLLF